jgi:hypothetical protein
VPSEAGASPALERTVTEGAERPSRSPSMRSENYRTGVGGNGCRERQIA